jgi:hypothetical protein
MQAQRNDVQLSRSGQKKCFLPFVRACSMGVSSGIGVQSRAFYSIEPWP